MTVRSSELRRNLFRLLDECIESGEPIRVERRSGAVTIVPERRRVPIGRLPARPDALVDGESLDEFSPSEWSPD